MMTPRPPAAFVPADLRCAEWAQLEPLYRSLLERPLASAAEVERWLLDLSALSASVSEYGSRCNIERSCHTDDPEAEKRYRHFVENIAPRIKPVFFDLQKKLLACPHAAALADPKYRQMEREWRMEVGIFRPANVPLQTELSLLATEYDKLCGAMLVSFRGKEYTLQQLARFGEEPDRATREEAWRLAEDRRARDRDALEAIFEKMLDLRARIAANADCTDYRAYAWKAFCRFDYAPDDCLRFADTVERAVLPLVEDLNRKRAADLGLAGLRPWDLAVDPRNRPPLKPFPADDAGRLVAGSARAFDRIAPQLGARFRELKPGTNLDLDSRRGKRPGGFQASLEAVREPFIFMNAAGLQRDVETLLHEAGHAFHYQQARTEPLLFVRHAPLEFCEVASMSMELLGDDHLDVFYDDADAARAKRVHLEGIVRLLPWIATVDLFQHWLYTHPGHSRDQRAQAWLDTHRRFSSTLVDWTGLDDVRRSYWQRQLHLFHHPFYYIEYGIAQLGALQVWRRWRNNRDAALTDLLAAFGLGGTRPLPDLFAAAGIRFDFSPATLQPLIQAVSDELARLPG